ncbi:TetR/AcrR family transcriptional regulator [Mycobacterium cookii]|uniref:TetR family transcriptional regulator n=1 Tax=Mycobacterium cookii TaxID=1775 RepID=A0A7I7KZI4_9MYCO|nr:TetR/AcrR family transcriptional regulator [Mycobacterium cookii]MCV7330516.1 TetR/AcrR family transcriptional regulator [Mycobacterium cookii]BBX47293.1 TetR family transcriptional regulator [Mycobacterium cookii]
MATRQAVEERGTSVGGGREAQRLQTRARLFDVALTEIARSGLAGADVSAIAKAAGVVRGTFYFHFPTKEHVLVELERNEEVKIVEELTALRAEADDVETMLSTLVQRVSAAKHRLGVRVFREMLALHFSSTRPVESELARHPLAEFLIGVLAEAQQAGRVVGDADPAEIAVFVLTGLFALLATGAHDSGTPDALLSRYVRTVVKGLEKR